jgi:hypothetical protein
VRGSQRIVRRSLSRGIAAELQRAVRLPTNPNRHNGLLSLALVRDRLFRGGLGNVSAGGDRHQRLLIERVGVVRYGRAMQHAALGVVVGAAAMHRATVVPARARLIGLCSPAEASRWRRPPGRSVARRETWSRRITSATVAPKTSAACRSSELRRRVRSTSSSMVGSFQSRPVVRALRCSENTGDQHRQDAGQKDTVEGSGPADRSDRRPQALHLFQVEKIGSD